MRLAANAIAESNRKTLLMLLWSMVAAYVLLLASSFIQEGGSSYQLLFAFMLVYMVLCLVMVIRMPSLPAKYLTYGVFAVTVLLCLHASAFVDPDYINAEAYVFFLLFPILHLDASIRIDAATLLLAGVYLANILQYKSGKPLMLEASTIIGFTLLGVAVGHFMRIRTLRVLCQLEENRDCELHDKVLGIPNHKGLLRDMAALPMSPQAAAFIAAEELECPELAFGFDYDEKQLLALGAELLAAAQEQGIELYKSGGDIIGIVQPRMLEGVFQRLEPLYHVLNSFEYKFPDGRTQRLHFGIGASMCDPDPAPALTRAQSYSATARKDGKNRIVIQDEYR